MRGKLEEAENETKAVKEEMKRKCQNLQSKLDGLEKSLRQKDEEISNQRAKVDTSFLASLF